MKTRSTSCKLCETSWEKITSHWESCLHLASKKVKRRLPIDLTSLLIGLSQSCFISLHRYQSSHLIRGRKIDCCYRVNHKKVSVQASSPRCSGAPLPERPGELARRLQEGSQDNKYCLTWLVGSVTIDGREVGRRIVEFLLSLFSFPSPHFFTAHNLEPRAERLIYRERQKTVLCLVSNQVSLTKVLLISNCCRLRNTQLPPSGQSVDSLNGEEDLVVWVL